MCADNISSGLPKGRVALMISPSQSGNVVKDGLEWVLQQPNVDSVTVFYVDILWQIAIFNIKEGKAIIDETRYIDNYQLRAQAVNEKIKPIIDAKRQKWLDENIPVAQALANKYSAKKCHLMTINEFIKQNELQDEFDKAMMQVIMTANTDNDFKSKISKNVKYFGRFFFKLYGKGWHGNQLYGRFLTACLQKHAHLECAIVMLSKFLEFFQCLTHSGQLNMALDYFRKTYTLLDGKTIDQYQPFFSIDKSLYT